MSSFMPCGCGKPHPDLGLPVPRCGDCGVEVNGCRKHGSFFSHKKWEYVCDVCLRQRQTCQQCGERHLNHQREGDCYYDRV